MIKEEWYAVFGTLAGEKDDPVHTNPTMVYYPVKSLSEAIKIKNKQEHNDKETLAYLKQEGVSSCHLQYKKYFITRTTNWEILENNKDL
ncbi:hypothetical protein LCGC14_1389590 [marine sediment metagenome]|uniref:Uncharacterized protein n=1 Tax=marine sediment metagenome TaxID=412755 RepID=A0A0F9MFX3_9ZZZZ